MPSAQSLKILLKVCLPALLLILLKVNANSLMVREQVYEARAYIRSGQHQLAAEALRDAAAREPWRIDLWEQIGVENLAAGQVDQAIIDLIKAREAGALSVDGLTWLAEAYQQQGSVQQAEAVWQTLLREDGPSAYRYEQLVHLQRSRGDLQSVVETLAEWRTEMPEDARAAFLLGLHLSLSEPDEAVRLLINAAALDSRYAGQVQTVRRGIGLANTSDHEAYRSLVIGRALGSAGHWDLAAEAFRQSIAIAPEYAEAWAFLGEARYHLDGQGKDELDKALQAAADSPVVRALLAVYWRRQGVPEKALPYLEANARLEPKEPIWLLEIGQTHAESGDLIHALEYFQKVVEMYPERSVYYQHLAQFSVQYSFDIRSIGLPAARQALLLAPRDPAALDIMGYTLLALGDSASAERFLQRALEEDATFAAASLHLGQLYLEQNAVERARPFLRQAADFSGDDTVGMVARRLLLQYFGESG